MRPDYHKNKDEEHYRIIKKKSKSSEKKTKNSCKQKSKNSFRNQVQDFIDNRDDKEYRL